jgi:DNA mismatch repair protein MutS
MESFRSILFTGDESARNLENQPAPECFADLHLDQVIEAVTAKREEYNLKPFFHTPLNRRDEIEYRQEIFRDLEDESFLAAIQLFAQQMRGMRRQLAEAGKMFYDWQKRALFLDAVDLYCHAVSRLVGDLSSARPASRGIQAVSDYLEIYAKSHGFSALAAETAKLKTDLAGIRYSLRINGSVVRVDRYGSEPDYGADVLQTFEKFKQGLPREYKFRASRDVEMNHVEAAILDRVAYVYSDIFGSLEAYRSRWAAYLDETIAAFDREVQFYIAYLEYIAPFRRAGLSFCYPRVSDSSKETLGKDVFDLALAAALEREKVLMVTNDFELRDPERIVIVSGPNQGGKTTFARTFGQMHYLGAIGCPVAGSAAQLFLYDRIFTHFEREEDLGNLTGKLEEELLRIHGVLDAATPASLLIMNESFLSTTLDDALFLSREIMRRIVDLDILCVSVTFLDELASLTDTTVSMVSSIDPSDPAVRTFKIIRKPADGLAYAGVIARKHRLTYDMVKARVTRRTSGPTLR